MLRLSTLRSAVSLAILLFALSAAACGSRGENLSSNDAASNTSRTNANQTNASVTTATQPSNNPAKAKLNLNTASENDFLTAIPGLGGRMVHEFEEYRPYNSIQQFRREIGKYVKPEQVAEYEKYVYVPIDVNKADAATLQQIPGLDATEVQTLMAARPYASPDVFLTKLAGSVSEAELAVAKTYLSNQ